MFRKNKDIFFFQIINWGLNFLTFYVFLKHVHNFSEIVQAEVMFGAVGAFFLFYSSKELTNEYRLFFLRYGIIILLLVYLVFCGGVYKVYAFAFISVLSIPAHLPIKFGFHKSIYLVLFGLKLTPLLSYSYTSEQALIYFLPNFIYGVYLYALYYKKFDVMVSGKTDVIAMVTHFSSISALYFIQSLYVAKVMTLAPMLILAEKLTRSAWGFLQPYILRHNPNKGKMQYFYLAFFAALVMGADNYILFIIPVVIDSYMLFSGYKKRFDVMFLILFVVLYIAGK